MYFADSVLRLAKRNERKPERIVAGVFPKGRNLERVSEKTLKKSGVN